MAYNRDKIYLQAEEAIKNISLSEGFANINQKFKSEKDFALKCEVILVMR